MKAKLITCGIINLIIFANMAMADTVSPRRQTFDLGFEASGIVYQEPGFSVKESGAMEGLYGAYEFRPQWPVLNVLHLDAHGDYANMDYKGSGTIKNINDFTAEPRIWLGQDFNVFPQLQATPYAGIGYRVLSDGLGGKVSSTGAQGYDRLSQYLYAPVGFELSTQAVDGWRFGFNAEYDIFIQGWQTSYLSAIQGYPDITNTQKRGYGIRGSFDIVRKGNDFNFIVSPYIRYWNIRQSEIATGNGSLFQVSDVEPANKSTEIGMRVGVEF